MGYTPENNPYIPGDPYSYDLAWMVQEVKAAQQVGQNAQQYANAALQSQIEAQQAKDLSMAWAIGEDDGGPIPPGEPQYENNAKYYAEQAADSAQSASDDAADAHADMLSAKDYADNIADPVSGIVTSWLDVNISNPSNPPVDQSLTVSGAAADAEVTGLKMDIALDPAKKYGVWYPFADISDWEQGAIVNGNLSAATNRIRTADYTFIPAGGKLIIRGGYTSDLTKVPFYAVMRYDIDKTYVDTTGWIQQYHEETFSYDGFIKLCIRNNDASNIVPSEMNITTVISCGKLSTLNVIAMGDSIGYGARNGLNGYIGKVGCCYKNVAVAGATISMYKANNIPSQLINVTGYTPDAIILNGGINDYGENVSMGSVPTRVLIPAIDGDIDSMDHSTVMAALSYTFYKMIELYPDAQRFFVMPNKTWGYEKDPNSAGWTFNQFHDNVEKVCKMYGVNIIDIYQRSPINSWYAEYRANTNYSETPPASETAWMNSDGIHPLPFGYDNGYKPFIQESLDTAATHK